MLRCAREQVLTGAWLVRDGCSHRDATCERIEWLIAYHLQKIAGSRQSGSWETLYRDPTTVVIGSGLTRKAKRMVAARRS
jgi:hypothetical protein